MDILEGLNVHLFKKNTCAAADRLAAYRPQTAYTSYLTLTIFLAKSYCSILKSKHVLDSSH